MLLTAACCLLSELTDTTSSPSNSVFSAQLSQQLLRIHLFLIL